MNQPIKVIWKYKNNNRRTQYAQYIFVGEVSSNLMKIMNKIANLNFYDTLINLSKDEYKPVNKTSSNITKYSDYQWHRALFLRYQLQYFFVYLIEHSRKKIFLRLVFLQ